jgi:ribosomal protein L21
LVITGDFGEPANKVNAKMLLLNNGDLSIGTPLLESTCTLEVVSVAKGKKIRVATYHPKARHRRVVGHRQFETTFKVLNWEKPAKKTAAKAKAE